jgi:hypothetical protein
MTTWPSVQISAPADSAIINLDQTGATTIDCQINQGGSQGGYRDLILFNCAASADCLTLTAQTKWLFFTVNVSIVLTDADAVFTATINAGGRPTVHQISMDDFNAAKAFVMSCKLPLVSSSFAVGRVNLE